MKVLHLSAFLLFLVTPSLAQKISTAEWKRMVPSCDLPKEINVKNSNNNLDVVKFNDRYYFAFRTALTHFASRKTVMYVLSSDNLTDWKLEQEIHHGHDLREPRFIVHDEKLFFYYFEGGKSPFTFNPRHIWVREFDPSRGWQAEQNIGLDGYVPWRLRTRNDTIYLSAYYGKDMYTSKHSSDLRLFTSLNGYNWEPLTEHSLVKGENAEEGEFIFDDDGHLWATVRLESEGSMIACADKNSPADWHVNYSKHKYDSALMFCRGEDIYVVSRRNVDGTMAKAPRWFSQNMKRKYNLIKYWLTTKKTALYRLDKSDMQLEHVMDFPSTGDTAFPGIVKMDDNNFLLMNYSSNIRDKNRNWFAGQLGKTYIYWTILTFSNDADEVSGTPVIPR